MSVAFANVTVRYGRRAALEGVSLAFAPGAVTGIVGPNGAGKTTLFRAALGLVPLAEGMVRIQNKPRKDWTRAGLARHIAYLPQGADAHWPMQARELVTLGRIPWRGAFAALSPADHAAVERALARADAQAFADRPLDALSAGERARVLFARALATGAPVLLADEPAAWLDPAHQLRLMELLREEALRGTAVAVTLHDLSLASRFCDRIAVLDKGGLAAEGAPGTALSDATLAQVFGIAALRATDPEGGSVLAAWRRI